MAYELSKYQKDIINHVVERKGSLFIEAVAGSSKTTTLVEVSKVIQSNSVIFLAFNKHIADELKTRLPSHFDVRTINSLGYKILRDNFGSLKVEPNKTDNIIDMLYEKKKWATFPRFRYVIRMIVSLAKLNGVVPSSCEGFTGFYDDNFFDQIVIENESIFMKIDEAAKQDKEDYQIAFDKYSDVIIKCSKMVLEESINEKYLIDFDDQIYLPIIHELKVRPFDYILCDESQDLSPIQIALIHKFYGPTTIILGVGDFSQSIYQFRGADEQAIEKFKTLFKCESKPLTICYRCPKSVIKEAQIYNSRIEAWENAKEGIVKNIENSYSLNDFQDGHTVLARFNAPLLDIGLKLIQEGIPFRFEGKALGRELVGLVKSFNPESIFDLKTSLDIWYENKVKFFEDRQMPDQITAIADKYFSLHAICGKLSSSSSIYEVTRMIDKIFGGNYGVKLSTIHKSKGLESDTIWILDVDKLPYKHGNAKEVDQQEINILYVALTRSKDKMFYIKSSPEFRERFYERKERAQKKKSSSIPACAQVTSGSSFLKKNSDPIMNDYNNGLYLSTVNKDGDLVTPLGGGVCIKHSLGDEPVYSSDQNSSNTTDMWKEFERNHMNT